MISVQREGSYDVLVRCLEDEAVKKLTGSEPAAIFGRLRYLSEYWLSGMYKSMRLIRDRDLVAKDDEAFAPIFRDIEFVRMGIDKHEIPKDRNMKEPLRLIALSGFATTVKSLWASMGATRWFANLSR